ncbi:heptaprenyl diphosphate synthase component 2 [Oxobacter pfennigii]|uniref:Heptaprenyl diphosphate synthase component 2 n=1 Tax=Oxobacter pfennigii TaxID=36849 RepID=A0A0P8WZX1_9CLOT|nr:polyprenyl synthetase family protein [Oxobacter pfennigii]KPU44054.1 heptaprenyl diphosphate synthase component 2 [Oxobacter pfennigii]
MSYKELDVIKDELCELEKFIVRSTSTPQQLISTAVNELIISGGKRIRPALTLLTGRALGNKVDKLIPIAACMEIIHMATLVHDDIVDDSVLRRGKSTIQSKYGKDIAVFAGDFLFSQAFMAIAQYADKSNLNNFAKAIKRICEGEIEQYESRYSLNISLLKYMRRIKRKTGVLLALSCVAGIANKIINYKAMKNMYAYGMNFGMAFQITDDILDYVGVEDTVGKPVGNDIKNGIYTLPLIYALNYSDRKEFLREKLNENLIDDNDTVNEIVEIVRQSGGVEYSINLVDRYIKKGLENIEVLKESKYKDSLRAIILSLKKREY